MTRSLELWTFVQRVIHTFVTVVRIRPRAGSTKFRARQTLVLRGVSVCAHSTLALTRSRFVHFVHIVALCANPSLLLIASTAFGGGARDTLVLDERMVETYGTILSTSKVGS